MRNQSRQGWTEGQGGRRELPGELAGHGGSWQREKFVKLIRHELNTPLATALLYLGIAEGSAAELPKGAVHSALRVARAEVQRLKTLLDTVTELECVGYATPRPRSINVGDDRSRDGSTFGCRSGCHDSSGRHPRRLARMVGSLDGRADRR